MKIYIRKCFSVYLLNNIEEAVGRSNVQSRPPFLITDRGRAFVHLEVELHSTHIVHTHCIQKAPFAYQHRKIIGRPKGQQKNWQKAPFAYQHQKIIGRPKGRQKYLQKATFAYQHQKIIGRPKGQQKYGAYVLSGGPLIFTFSFFS